MSKNKKMKQKRVMPCDNCTISNVCAQKEDFIKQALHVYETTLDDIPFTARITCPNQQKASQ